MITLLIVFLGALAASVTLMAILDRTLPAGFLVAGINSRSNHHQPARQIGGLAVAPSAIAVLALAGLATAQEPAFLAAAVGGAALLFAVGYLDDRYDLSVGIRFGCQFVAAAMLVLALDADVRLLPPVFPYVVERSLLLLCIVWFVNMVNFMDGLDLMVVSGVGIPHALLAVAGALALIDSDAALVSAAVAGALFGFARVNWPPARVFLGDSGSLSVGFLTGAVVLLIAKDNPWAAALPFLYFLVDSVSVIVLRLSRGENVLKAHSIHAYQLARRAGRPVLSIASEVAVLGVICSGLFAVAIRTGSVAVEMLALAAGLVVTAAAAWRMRRLARR